MGTFLRWIAIASLALVAIAAIALGWIWNDRPDPRAIGIPVAASATGGTQGGVTMTWLGVTTLLFDDGETQLLIDGFFSRPSLLDLALDREITPDEATIDEALATAGIERLAAVIPVHSHFDHAMDTAAVAQRTGAVVIGSPSTANLARGAGLPEARIRSIAGKRASHRFGRFEVVVVRSRHMPANDAGDPPYPGTIDAPLVPPAPMTAWREGGSFSIFVRHPSGTTLVQGSAGFVRGALARERADVVVLGVGGLSRLGRAYTGEYWGEIVRATGARRVVPAHWDDFTRPYGEIRPFPRALEDLAESFGWLVALAAAEATPVELELPAFGQPITLY